jgi:dinuclear metal center YbgI/SA1388 family protein
MMEVVAPLWMARTGDPVGLHAGNRKSRVTKILVTLDATLDAIRAARKAKCQMIIAHHPRFYKPLTNLDESTYMGKIAAELLRGKIALYCAHTNLDTAPGGINDALADLAGIANPRPLTCDVKDKLCKLVTFVPESHVEAVRSALCDAGAGCIGEYSDCSFRTLGLGTFKGSDATKPFLGTPGELAEEEEWRLEVILPRSLKDGVVRALLEAHPYEEVAYDIFALEKSLSYGLGRIGELKKPTTLKAFAAKMKKACASEETRVLGDLQKNVKKIAVWSGGGCPTSLVINGGVDAVALGEIGYHDTELLAQAGVGCVALGHGCSEAVALPRLAENLANALDGVEVVVDNSHLPQMRNV